MAFCSKCGAPVPDGTHLCPNCAMGGTSVQPAAPVPAVDPMIELAKTKMNETDFMMYQSIRNAELSLRQMKIWSMVTGIGAGFCALMVLVFMMMVRAF